MLNIKEKIWLTSRETWGILELSGKDRKQFLHNQTTNDIAKLIPGSGCETIFVNSTGRTLELAFVYCLEDSLWILVSSKKSQFIYQWIDRYIFPVDQVSLKDLSSDFRVLKIIGERSQEILQKIAPFPNPLRNIGDHQQIDSLRIAVGTGLDLSGYTLFIPADEYPQVLNQLITLGAIELENENELRIKQGRPLAQLELTDDYNALEAGLWRAISFTKGCYIGQETIARLNTYRGVKQRLWGINLNKEVPLNTPIFLQENKIGVLTSCCKISDSEIIGLGYIKTKAGGEGLEVVIGDAQGIIISTPYLSHDYYDPR
jgi:hypothetical protein